MQPAFSLLISYRDTMSSHPSPSRPYASLSCPGSGFHRPLLTGGKGLLSSLIQVSFLLTHSGPHSSFRRGGSCRCIPCLPVPSNFTLFWMPEGFLCLADHSSRAKSRTYFLATASLVYFALSSSHFRWARCLSSRFPLPPLSTPFLPSPPPSYLFLVLIYYRGLLYSLPLILWPCKGAYAPKWSPTV